MDPYAVIRQQAIADAKDQVRLLRTHQRSNSEYDRASRVDRPADVDGTGQTRIKRMNHAQHLDGLLDIRDRRSNEGFFDGAGQVLIVPG